MPNRKKPTRVGRLPCEASTARAAESGATSELGWTVVVCEGHSCSATLGPALQARLAAVVRASAYGMLITTADRTPGSGATLVVQRCTANDRRPVGLAHIVGPVETSTDIDIVCNWLALDEFDPRVLPKRLQRRRSTRQAALN